MPSLKNKISNKVTGLNLSRLVLLIFSIAPALTVLTIVFIIAESALWFGTMYASKNLIQLVGKLNINASNREHELAVSLAITFCIAILYAAVKLISGIIIEYQSSKVSEYIDSKIHEQAIQLDLNFYESPGYFDILKRAMDAGSAKPAAIITDLMELLRNLLMIVAIGTIIISIHWLLLPMLVLFVVPTMMVKINLARRLQEWKIKQTPVERKASYFSGLLTGDGPAKEIRAFGIGTNINKIYLGIRQSLLKERIAINKRNLLSAMLSALLAVAGVYSCVAIISFSTLNGKTSVGDLSIFIIIFLQSFGVLQSITSGISKLYANSIIVKCIFEMFDLKSNLDNNENALPIILNDGVLLKTENLHFTYPFSEKEILKNINIEVKRGKVIALVGFNGSGKSTLIKLLCRLYDADEGSVQYLGNDIKQYDIEQYRKEVSVVFQDFVRYNVSATDNIKYGNVDKPFDKEGISAAAKMAGADTFVSELPQGYDTMLGKIFENGHEISIGQWQKLAISRALYSGSQIIILDEATSALDAYSEEQLFINLRKGLGQKGALIISHRLSTIQKADYIYVMSKGAIQQSGTHEELIEQPGDYQQLFNNSIK
jgi:ATP-binding cassette, subfamily B, bacterial